MRMIAHGEEGWGIVRRSHTYTVDAGASVSALGAADQELAHLTPISPGNQKPKVTVGEAGAPEVCAGMPRATCQPLLLSSGCCA